MELDLKEPARCANSSRARHDHGLEDIPNRIRHPVVKMGTKRSSPSSDIDSKRHSNLKRAKVRTGTELAILDGSY